MLKEMTYGTILYLFQKIIDILLNGKLKSDIRVRLYLGNRVPSGLLITAVEIQ